MKNFVLQYPNGGLVGVDMSSGGYPFEAYNAEKKTGALSDVRFFLSRKEARDYGKSFFHMTTFEVKEFVFELK